MFKNDKMKHQSVDAGRWSAFTPGILTWPRDQIESRTSAAGSKTVRRSPAPNTSSLAFGCFSRTNHPSRQDSTAARRCRADRERFNFDHAGVNVSRAGVNLVAGTFGVAPWLVAINRRITPMSLQSETARKPEFIMGHSLQAVSLLVHAGPMPSPTPPISTAARVTEAAPGSMATRSGSAICWRIAKPSSRPVVPSRVRR